LKKPASSLNAGFSKVCVDRFIKTQTFLYQIFMFAGVKISHSENLKKCNYRDSIFECDELLSTYPVLVFFILKFL
jgi:hypothetical protein